MGNKLLYDHLIHHGIDHFHVFIVDMMHVEQQNEYQLEELLGRKEHKRIWDLGSITPLYDGFYCQNRKCGNNWV